MGWISRQRLISEDSRAGMDRKTARDCGGGFGRRAESATVGGAENGAAGWKNKNSRPAEVVESLAVRQGVSQENCVSGAESHMPQRHSSFGGVA